MHDIEKFVFFFFNDTATTEIYTLSLHDALPIFTAAQGLTLTTQGDNAYRELRSSGQHNIWLCHMGRAARDGSFEDRKSTRLNSSHANISYAVFCLKKKK